MCQGFKFHFGLINPFYVLKSLTAFLLDQGLNLLRVMQENNGLAFGSYLWLYKTKRTFPG